MHRQNGAHQERRRLKVDSTSVQTDAGNLPAVVGLYISVFIEARPFEEVQRRRHTVGHLPEDTNLTGPVVMELRIAGLVQALGATELRGQESPERDALRRLT